MKNEQKPKNKKMWNLVVPKPGNHNLRRKTTIEINISTSRNMKHSFFANTKLQIDQIKEKTESKFNKPLFI